MATAEQFIDEIKTLLTRSVEGNTQLAARLSALAQQAAKGGLPTDANDLLARWLDFNLASASLLSRHSLTALHGVLDAAERSLLGRDVPVVHDGPAPATPGADAPAGSTKGGAAAGAIDVHVEGDPGETVRAPFLIANEYDRTLEVSFEATPLGADGGATIPVERIGFEPATLSLGKGQRVVQAAIGIPGDAVRGATYRGEIRVKGFQARSIALALTVRAADAQGGGGATHQHRSSPGPTGKARGAGGRSAAPRAAGAARPTRSGGKRNGPRRGSS